MFCHQRRSRGGGRSSRRTNIYSFRRIDNKSESFVPKRDNVSLTQEEEKKVHSVFFARLGSVSSIRSYATFTGKVQTLRPAVFRVLTFIPYFSLPFHRIVLALDHLPQCRAKRRTTHHGSCEMSVIVHATESPRPQLPIIWNTFQLHMKVCLVATIPSCARSRTSVAAWCCVSESHIR